MVLLSFNDVVSTVSMSSFIIRTPHLFLVGRLIQEGSKNLDAAVAPPNCIWDMLSSNLGWDTDCSE